MKLKSVKRLRFIKLPAIFPQAPIGFAGLDILYEMKLPAIFPQAPVGFEIINSSPIRFFMTWKYP